MRKKVNKRPNAQNFSITKLIMFVLVFAAIGTSYLIFTQARPELGDPEAAGNAVKPFVEDKARGLVWEGIRKRTPEQGGKCGELYELVNADEVLGCTHGPDPAPEGIDVRKPVDINKIKPNIGGGVTGFLGNIFSPKAAAASANDIGLTCTGDGISDRRVKVVYAYAADRPNRYNQLALMMLANLGTMNRIFLWHGAVTGQAKVIRYKHDRNCFPIVHQEKLSVTGDDSYANLIRDLKSNGYVRNDSKYLVFLDGGNWCGTGTYLLDTNSSSSNLNNNRVGYAMIGLNCWTQGNTPYITPLHELIHTLGAVQYNAPHLDTKSLGHVNDYFDVMTPMAWHVGSQSEVNIFKSKYPCVWIGAGANIDCNYNDYFNSKPQVGSYLYNNWNIANSGFLQNY